MSKNVRLCLVTNYVNELILNSTVTRYVIEGSHCPVCVRCNSAEGRPSTSCRNWNSTYRCSNVMRMCISRGDGIGMCHCTTSGGSPPQLLLVTSLRSKQCRGCSMVYRICLSVIWDIWCSIEMWYWDALYYVRKLIMNCCEICLWTFIEVLKGNRFYFYRMGKAFCSKNNF